VAQHSSPAVTLTERAQLAAEIVEHPRRYKICEGCDSIVARRVATCPNCFGYRFNTGQKAIINQARVLGSREKTSVTAEDLL
jgi:hypothetical protein